MTQNDSNDSNDDSIAGGSSGDESDVETEPGLTLKRKVSFEKKIILPMMEIFVEHEK